MWFLPSSRPLGCPKHEAPRWHVVPMPCLPSPGAIVKLSQGWGGGGGGGVWHKAGGGGGGGGQGCIRRGGRGVWLGPPSSQGPPVVPAEGGPKIVKLKSSWHRRRRSKILAVSLKHWKGRREGGRVPGGGAAPLLLRCTAVLLHPMGGGGDQLRLAASLTSSAW